MNLYEKMQVMRCALQDSNLRKTGKNPFAKYEYFELQDIMPTINKLMLNNKVTSELSFGKEIVCLKFINTEKPDEVMSFTCPIEMAVLKGCHPAQNLGATITYIRRYLYINAFEIVEHDALDRMPMDNTSQNAHKPDSQPAQVTKKEKPTPTAPRTQTPQESDLMVSIVDRFEAAKTQIEIDMIVKEYKLKISALPEDSKKWLRERCVKAQERVEKEIIPDLT